MSAQPALLPHTRSGRTFLIAAIVLGVVCAAQLGALGWHLVSGASRNKASVVTAAPPASGADADAMPRADELLGAPTPAPPAPSPATQIAARAMVTTRDLVSQARNLRQRGDTNAALARLREAQLTAPTDPDVLA